VIVFRGGFSRGNWRRGLGAGTQNRLLLEIAIAWRVMDEQQRETVYYCLGPLGSNKVQNFTVFNKLVAAIRKAQAKPKVKDLWVQVYLVSSWLTLGEYRRDANKFDPDKWPAGWKFSNRSLKPHIRDFIA
jgi:hypothetical protein